MTAAAQTAMTTQGLRVLKRASNPTKDKPLYANRYISYICFLFTG